MWLPSAFALVAGFQKCFFKIRLYALTLAYYTGVGIASVSLFGWLAVGAAVANVFPPTTCSPLSSVKENLRQLVSNVLQHDQQRHPALCVRIQTGVVQVEGSAVEFYVLHVSTTTRSTKSETETDTTSGSSCRSKPKQPLLLIHGMNTSPLYFRPLFFSGLTEGADLILLALPGFGLVDIPPEIVNGASSAEVLSFYTEYLCQVVKQLFGGCPPVVLGHSFGAYLAAACYCRHRALVKQVIFVNGIGLFPFIGGHGKHWSMFFKMGLPLFFTRPFGEYLNPLFGWLIAAVARCRGWSPEERNRWVLSALLTTCSTNHSDLLCARFITDRFTDACWNLPIGRELLGKELRLSFVWGLDDPIISCHVAKFLVDCSVFTENTPFRLIYVKGGGHDPITWNHGTDLSCCVQQLIQESIATNHQEKLDTELVPMITTTTTKATRRRYAFEVMSLLDSVVDIDNTGVFCVKTTEARIQSCYHKLTEHDWFRTFSSKHLFIVMNGQQETHTCLAPDTHYFGLLQKIKSI